MSTTRKFYSVLGICCLATIHAAAASVVSVAEIQGTIGPATADYLRRAIDVAADERAACLVVRLDTPGGLLESTKHIVQAFYASEIPVVVYVAPAGAGATSAGCFITLASDVAAMAPGTTIGAAHPVASGGGEMSDTMKEKLENYAATFVASIAERRHRNVEWARKAVVESASITAERALDSEVIEIVANDMNDLLRQLDGRVVAAGKLRTADAEIRTIPLLVRERVFQVLWRPEVLFILMLVAVYGIIGEISNPGAIVPGVAGVVALILALYMSAVLPVNIAGIALIVLAIALFVLEALTPTFGLLTAGGAVAFFLGGLMLFDSVAPQFRLSWSMLVPATLITTAFFVFVVAAGLRAQRLPTRLGPDALAGTPAVALTDIDAHEGRVCLAGENWRAISRSPIARGSPVRVTGARSGLTVEVEPDKEKGTGNEHLD